MLRKVVVAALALAGIPAAWCQTIQPPYSSSYTLVTLGGVPGVPQTYAGITFVNYSTLLMGGQHAGSDSGNLYQFSVVRGTNGHITGFGASSSLYASAPGIDGGLEFGPGGILFATGYPDNVLYEYKPGSTSPDQTIDLSPLGVVSSVGALQFVPMGLPGAGEFKIVSTTGTEWYDATLTQNSSGTYDVSNVVPEFTLGSPLYLEASAYVPPNSPLFGSPSVLVLGCAFSTVCAYAVDSDGNPSGTSSTFVSGFLSSGGPSGGSPDGAVIDPITGDLLITVVEYDVIVEIQGFSPGSLTATAGSPQSAIVNNPFAGPLTITLEDPYGNPVGGVPVNFAAPTSGASAALSATSAVTAADGTASVTATANATAGSYNVTATLYGLSATFSLTNLSNIAIEGVALSPTSVIGGNSTTSNTVILTSAPPGGGATIALASSDPAAASVPASVTVAGGSTVSAPFTISTSAVAASTHVSIKASDGANTKAATLTVISAALTAVALSPRTVVGGKSTTNNTVTLSGQAPPAGAVVTLLSSDPTVAAVPGSVTVPAGAAVSPLFTVTTTAVAAQTPVTISATYNGVTKNATLTVDSPKAALLRLSPASVTGGHSTTHNSVTLNGPAPAGGAVVMLTSGDPSVATPPTTVTVAAGATSAAFTITTTVVTTSTVVPITATFGGSSITANLTVAP
jgi:hypothetical protein